MTLKKCVLMLALIASALSVPFRLDGVLAHGPGGKPSKAFQAYEKGKIPTAFKDRKNPLAKSQVNVTAGMTLYQKNCVMCHGANAMGQGHMAADMEVKPANLRMMLRHFPAIDEYYLWVISNGGDAFDVPMPGFADQLSENQIWQVVSWMQAGFPGAGSQVKDKMHHDGPMPEMHKRMHGKMPGMMKHPMGSANPK